MGQVVDISKEKSETALCDRARARARVPVSVPAQMTNEGDDDS
jgi:hypothetical protein